jgi:hypothetical protein
MVAASTPALTKNVIIGMLFMLFIRTYIEKPSINWTNSPRVSSTCRLMPMQRSKSSLVLKPPAAKGWCQIMPNLYEKTLTGITNGCKTLYYFGPGGQNTNNSSQQTNETWLAITGFRFISSDMLLHSSSFYMPPHNQNTKQLCLHHQVAEKAQTPLMRYLQQIRTWMSDYQFVEAWASCNE